MHEAITEGVLEAHAHGIVTACSVVANGRDFDRAAGLLRSTPSLEVGLHLTLVGERALSARAPSLAPGGELPAGYPSFLTRLAFGRIDLGEIEREARLQLDRAREAGLRIARIDGHQHLHVAPGVSSIVARLARESGIAYARVPWEPGLRITARGLAVWSLGRLARRARDRFRAAGLATNDTAIGIGHAGRLTAGRVREALREVRGVAELVTHPGRGNERIARAYGWGYDWDGEREMLRSAELREELERRGVRLVRASDLPRATMNA